MVQVNEYFDGNVKSLSVSNFQGRATVGVMEPGDYEFGTGDRERMTLISGKWLIKLPGSAEFRRFDVGETFEVPANARFGLRIEEQSAYLCRFGG